MVKIDAAASRSLFTKAVPMSGLLSNATHLYFDAVLGEVPLLSRDEERQVGRNRQIAHPDLVPPASIPPKGWTRMMTTAAKPRVANAMISQRNGDRRVDDVDWFTAMILPIQICSALAEQ